MPPRVTPSHWDSRQLPKPPNGRPRHGALPRRKLGGSTIMLLILLRIYVLVTVPIVIYAFVRALHTS